MNPNFAVGYTNLAGSAMVAGKSDEAISLFQIALKEQPDCGGAHAGLANALMSRHEYAAALPEWVATVNWRRIPPEPDIASALH